MKKIKRYYVIFETAGGFTLGETIKSALKKKADYILHNGAKIPIEKDDDPCSLDFKYLYLSRDKDCDLDKLMRKYRRMSQRQKNDAWHELVGR